MLAQTTFVACATSSAALPDRDRESTPRPGASSSAFRQKNRAKAIDCGFFRQLIDPLTSRGAGVCKWGTPKISAVQRLMQSSNSASRPERVTAENLQNVHRRHSSADSGTEQPRPAYVTL